MNNIQLALVAYAFAWVPYLLVTWAYTKFTDGDAERRIIGAIAALRRYYRVPARRTAGAFEFARFHSSQPPQDMNGGDFSNHRHG